MIHGTGLDFYFVERDLVSQSDSVQQLKITYKQKELQIIQQRIYSSASGKLIALESDQDWQIKE